MLATHAADEATVVARPLPAQIADAARSVGTFEAVRDFDGSIVGSHESSEPDTAEPTMEAEQTTSVDRSESATMPSAIDVVESAVPVATPTTEIEPVPGNDVDSPAEVLPRTAGLFDAAPAPAPAEAAAQAVADAEAETTEQSEDDADRLTRNA
jgi:hypothetical protein